MPAIGLSLATLSESFTGCAWASVYLVAMTVTAAVMAELVGEIKQGPAMCIFLQYVVSCGCTQTVNPLFAQRVNAVREEPTSCRQPDCVLGLCTQTLVNPFARSACQCGSRGAHIVSPARLRHWPIRCSTSNGVSMQFERSPHRVASQPDVERNFDAVKEIGQDGISGYESYHVR